MASVPTFVITFKIKTCVENHSMILEKVMKKVSGTMNWLLLFLKTSRNLIA